MAAFGITFVYKSEFYIAWCFENSFQEVKNITLLDAVLNMFADNASTKKYLPEVVKLVCIYYLVPLMSAPSKRCFSSRHKNESTQI